MKKLFAALTIFLSLNTLSGQISPVVPDSIGIYFNQIKDATRLNRKLWNKDLYGPVLLVNPGNRQLFANVPDSAGLLKPSGLIYSCILPGNVNIANTSSHWSGIDWAMVLLPLPVNKQDRINLIAHELFHVAQPSLGFILFNVSNNHLDRKEGRIYLRLELEALKKAVQSLTVPEMKKYLTDAFTFRKYRYLLFPGADSIENLLELNEGMAEYTGMIICQRNKVEAVKHFVEGINVFMSNPTFVRSFPYQTTPAYGYLLYSIKENWNREITIKTNLTNYFIDAFNLSLPTDLQKRVEAVSDQYNAPMIIAEETEREVRTKKLIAENKNKFIDQPHFEIQFEKMNVSFDTRNLMPVEDKGTLYINIRVTDNWGILSVGKGALMSPGWDKISVSIPLKIDNKTVSGDGWTLQLNDGYTVFRDEKTGNFTLKKN